ncbi:alpha/beta fold hydrolase [Streptomyces sp. NPDC005279]|uniref:alpha/beta fold hydrolase n=1 Tax=Streptomyces sp. NPDC005279 TaxID=3364712 RepID=UPI0036C60BFD
MSDNTSAHAHTAPLIGGTPLTWDDQGTGRPFLLLHGGAGPGSVLPFATLLARHGRVLTPTHPGFAGRPRPDSLDSISGLASVYLDLLQRLDLRDVTVVGNSLGGWIASELALRDPSRIGRIVLVNAVGIHVDGDATEIADIFALHPDQAARLAFHDPSARPDPAALTSDELAAAAANRTAAAVYAGDPYMHDPELRRRLRSVEVPVLVTWGRQDGIVSPAYGRAYAESFAAARFELVEDAGHFPQIEQPTRLLGLIREFAGDTARPVHSL